MRELKLRTLGVLSLQLTATTALALLSTPFTPHRREALPHSPYSTSSGTGGNGYSYTELESGVRIYGQTAAQARDVLAPLGQRDASSSSSSGGGGTSRALPNDLGGWCNDTWISNDGSDNSPLISDCQVIATQVYELAGSSNAYFGRGECGPDSTGEYTCYYPVVSYGTCMFGASTISAGLDVSVRIGWADVGDLVTSSIAQFGGNPAADKVGASGEMDCPEEILAVLLYLTGWGIYHS